MIQSPELVAQLRGAVPTGTLELITHGTPITHGVLIFLGALSLLSWAIMLGMWHALSKANRSAMKFQREFHRAARVEDAAKVAKRSPNNSLGRLFMTAVHFVGETRAVNQQAREAAMPADGGLSTVTEPGTTALTGSQIETLYLLMENEAATERDRMGRFIPWLATIASVSPLVGLFGTVVGVIHAFLGIAVAGSGNLAAVAPGVAEALIATAAALAVAIPATFGYNIFANRLNRYGGMMEGFGTSVIALLVREGHI